LTIPEAPRREKPRAGTLEAPGLERGEPSPEPEVV